jgi:hypothetical protein
MITVSGTSTAITAATSSTSAAFAPASTAGSSVYISNSGVDRVTVAFGEGSATAVQDAGLTIPPQSWVVIDANPRWTFFAVISPAAGGVVVATPVLIN